MSTDNTAPDLPIRPKPFNEGLPAGERGDLENDADPDDADADDPGLTTEDLGGSNADIVDNATSDLDGDADDQPDSDNPNDYGED